MARPQHLGNLTLGPAPKVVRPPDELTDKRSRRLYAGIVRELGAHGTWSPGFRHPTLLFCQSEAVYRKAYGEVEEKGYDGGDGKPSVAYQVMEKERRNMLALGKVLGMTPQTLATMLRGGVPNPGRQDHKAPEDQDGDIFQ